MRKWKISLGTVTEIIDSSKRVVGLVKNKLLSHNHYEIKDSQNITYYIKRKGISLVSYEVIQNNDVVLCANVSFDTALTVRPSRAIELSCILDGKKYELRLVKNRYSIFVDDVKCGEMYVGRLVHCDIVVFDCDIADWAMLCMYAFAKLMLHEDDLYVA